MNNYESFNLWLYGGQIVTEDSNIRNYLGARKRSSNQKSVDAGGSHPDSRRSDRERGVAAGDGGADEVGHDGAVVERRENDRDVVIERRVILTRRVLEFLQLFNFFVLDIRKE